MFRVISTLGRADVGHFVLPSALKMLGPLRIVRFVQGVGGHCPSARFSFRTRGSCSLTIDGMLTTMLDKIGKLRAAVGKLNRHTNGTPLTDIRTVLGSRFGTVAGVSRDHLGSMDHIMRSCSNVIVPTGGPVMNRGMFARITKMRTSKSGGDGLCYGSLLPRQFNQVHRCTLKGASNGTGVHGGLRDLNLRLSRRSVQGIARHVVRLKSGGRLIARRSLPCVVSSMLGRSNVGGGMGLGDCFMALTRKLGPVTALDIRVSKRVRRRDSSKSNRCSTFIHTLHGVCGIALKQGFPVLVGCTMDVPPNKHASTFMRAIVA